MWEFIERYFIRPVYTGEGYNAFNTAAYAAAFIVGLYAVKWLMGKWKIRINRRLLYALLPYFVFAGLARALEDWWPVKHWLLITPGIYLLMAALVVAVLLASGKSLASTKRVGWALVAAAGGLVAAVAYAGAFRIVWLFAVLGMAAAIVVVLWKIFPHLLATREDRLVAFSQALDGSATAMSISLLGYTEQHVVSGWVMQANPFYFLIVKVVLVLAAIYILNKEKSEWGWLLKIAIVLLGLAPGTRDLTRAFIGV